MGGKEVPSCPLAWVAAPHSYCRRGAARAWRGAPRRTWISGAGVGVQSSRRKRLKRWRPWSLEWLGWGWKNKQGRSTGLKGRKERGGGGRGGRLYPHLTQTVLPGWGNSYPCLSPGHVILQGGFSQRNRLPETGEGSKRSTWSTQGSQACARGAASPCQVHAF